MYAALLKQKLVLAVEEAEQVRLNYKRLNDDCYRCPHCQKKVILIMSEKKAAFFKHVALYSGQLGEKEEHHTAKMLIKSAFTAIGFDAKTEIPLAEGQIRADVLVSTKFAIEVQCAPLSLQEFSVRHQHYLHENILDLWVVGRRHYLKRKIKHTQLIFFRRNKSWGHYYVEVDPVKQILRLKYNVWQEPLTRKIVYQAKIFKLDESGLKAFWHFKPVKKQFVLNPARQREYLNQQLRQKTKFGRMIAEKLYLRRLNVTDLPDKVFSSWRRPGSEDNISKFLHKKTNQR